MAEPAITFFDYDRISDTLIYFSQDIIFRFNVQLSKKDKYDHRNFFHKEYEYMSKYSDTKYAYSIKRDMTFYYSIDDNRNYMNGVMIGINDVYLLDMFIKNNILPWYIGDKSIYGNSPDNNGLIIKGKWRPQQFALSDYKYMTFMPIVLTYDDNKTNFGIRLVINKEDNFVDIDLNKFLAFYQIISKTDMYSVASNMVNYVKTMPYNVNSIILHNGSGNSTSKSYFGSI